MWILTAPCVSVAWTTGLEAGQGWKTNTALARATAQREAELGDEGRVPICPSGTEPVGRVVLAARDAGQAQAFVGRIAAALR